MLGTIPYEITCWISARVKREYINTDKIDYIKNNNKIITTNKKLS
jgi:hypothetical protein